MTDPAKVNTIAIGVIAYNEHNYLPDLLEDVLHQTFPKERTELVLVDGKSTDDTRSIMMAFQQKHANEYLRISVLDNPKRNQPSGWNVVLGNYQADVIFRIDAHARLPEDFVEQNVKCIESGEYVCGGPRENIIDEDTSWKQMLLAAEQSMFGSGIASYRNETEERKYVNSLFHGAYRREVIEKVGNFNEQLLRTEDNEYHYRVRQAGYKICYDPKIHSSYQTRNSLKRMLKQKYQNGFWIGKTIKKCPGCISIFHLVPFGFVMAILAALVLMIFGIWWPIIALGIAYGAADLLMTVTAIISMKKRGLCCLLLPILFFLLHTSYGVGTLFGLVSF